MVFVAGNDNKGEGRGKVRVKIWKGMEIRGKVYHGN